MLTFSFTVGSADEARTAAEVCDFLAEQMTSPTVRKPRASKTVNTVQLPNDKPALVISELASSRPFAGTLGDMPPTVSDPAALYAALSGAPVAENGAAQESPSATAVGETREQRIERTREAVKARGGKWLGDYFKVHNPAGKKLSDHTDIELHDLYTAAVSGA